MRFITSNVQSYITFTIAVSGLHAIPSTLGLCCGLLYHNIKTVKTHIIQNSMFGGSYTSIRMSSCDPHLNTMNIVHLAYIGKLQLTHRIVYRPIFSC